MSLLRRPNQPPLLNRARRVATHKVRPSESAYPACSYPSSASVKLTRHYAILTIRRS